VFVRYGVTVYISSQQVVMVLPIRTVRFDRARPKCNHLRLGMD
jgi:hypothetical protein